MPRLVPVSEQRSARERFQVDLGRTVDRLRTLGLARLEASFEPETTRADAARGVAQWLADAAADLDGRARRELPVLAALAVGDQVAVCGHDLVAACARAGSAGAPGGDAGPEPATDAGPDAVLERAADLLLDLRRRI